MIRISEDLWIAPQLSDDDYERAGQQGVTHIVNNRPDGESPDQPTAAEARQHAGAAGLGYTHIPIVPGKIAEDDVRRFQAVVAEAAGPVLAHCKTGTRSLHLWAIGEVLDGRMAIAEMDDLGARAGVDMGGAKKWLESNG